jgi:hypothetical protein
VAAGLAAASPAQAETETCDPVLEEYCLFQGGTEPGGAACAATVRTYLVDNFLACSAGTRTCALTFTQPSEDDYSWYACVDTDTSCPAVEAWEGGPAASLCGPLGCDPVFEDYCASPGGTEPTGGSCLATVRTVNVDHFLACSDGAALCLYTFTDDAEADGAYWYGCATALQPDCALRVEPWEGGFRVAPGCADPTCIPPDFSCLEVLGSGPDGSTCLLVDHAAVTAYAGCAGADWACAFWDAGSDPPYRAGCAAVLAECALAAMPVGEAVYGIGCDPATPYGHSCAAAVRTNAQTDFLACRSDEETCPVIQSGPGGRYDAGLCSGTACGYIVSVCAALGGMEPTGMECAANARATSKVVYLGCADADHRCAFALQNLDNGYSQAFVCTNIV